MSLLQIIVLALIQGITEYLPISSSGHSILVPALTGWPDQGVLTDAITNLGTLFATTIYFWRDVLTMLRGLLDVVMRQSTAASRLVINVIIATIPVIVLGLFFHFTKLDDHLRYAGVVAFNAVFFGILLYTADAYGLSSNKVSDINPRSALLFGLAQMLALNPGTSRSGVTMTAGRFLGFARSDAARFSFLMSIPANAAGSVVKIGSALKAHEHIGLDMILCGVLTFFIGLGTIHFLMGFIRSHSFLPFAIYRVILGSALLGLIYAGVQFGAVN
ncbi:MAG: undecaprenyl-diphosphate phosphatase [Alphaproteobacteria bacterium]|nr:undecaprenyl-diphosphate phosphatase [Alphaproteobacteria bacterium]